MEDTNLNRATFKRLMHDYQNPVYASVQNREKNWAGPSRENNSWAYAQKDVYMPLEEEDSVMDEQPDEIKDMN